MEEYPFKVNNEDIIGFNLDFEQLFAHKKGSEERFFYFQLFCIMFGLNDHGRESSIDYNVVITLFEISKGKILRHFRNFYSRFWE